MYAYYIYIEVEIQIFSMWIVYIITRLWFKTIFLENFCHALEFALLSLTGQVYSFKSNIHSIFTLLIASEF